jgi:hypothetical protein
MAVSSERRGPRPAFRVGDRVRFNWGVTPVEGQVVEDRGAIGYHGRRLYRIVVDMPDQYFHLDIELPEEDLQAVK